MTQALKKLHSVVQGSKNAVILIYGNPDPDGLASAWALKEIFSSWGILSQIGYTGEVGRLQNSAMIQALKIPAQSFQRSWLDHHDLLATVDAQPLFFKEMALPSFQVVIDHHPRKVDRTTPFVDIRPKCLATASIMTEYLHAADLTLSKKMATALLYGIITDSRGQRKSASSTDLDALAELEKIADRNLLRRIEFSQYSLADLEYFSIALLRLRHAGNVLYSHIGSVPYTDVCVQVADFLIHVKEATWALVTGVVKNKLVVVFRCDGYKKNAGKVAAKTFGMLGSAGGHATMGRAEISPQGLPKEITLMQNEKLQEFVVGALARSDPAFRPLQQQLKNIFRHEDP